MIKIFSYLLSVMSILLLMSCSDETPTILRVKKHDINVNGKLVDIYRIEQADGTWGYRGIKGQKFNVIVENNLSVPTSVHWHGIILPNNQDGVPFVTQEPIEPNQVYKYNFELKQKGTYWMHSHYKMQSQEGLAAPLILYDTKNNDAYQEVIMFVTDFSFRSPEEILADLREGATTITKNTQKNNMNDMKMTIPSASHKNMVKATPDLNDVKYDAYLVNYKATDNPDIIAVDLKKKVLLRIINAASASDFIINLGKLKGEAIAIDGNNIIPFVDSKFELAVAQRIDILVELPTNNTAYSIFAQGQGTAMQAGLVLKAGNVENIILSSKASEVAPALDYAQELILKAQDPLPVKKIDRSLILYLEGSMVNYNWMLNGKIWPNTAPLMVNEGERVEIIFNNKSMMAHPMHLHGHTFQVTEIDGKKINGAMRDTINILPNSIVKIQFDANNPGIWMLHCHVLYHAIAGMSTTLNYEGFKAPEFYKR